MKIAIISDIHANLEALEACLKKIDEMKADKIICLGDLVDYCAQPNECIDLVRKNSDVIIVGNHDEAQFHYDLVTGFSENAMVSSIHTRSVIDPEHVEYFKTLPYSYSEGKMFFVHGSPYRPERYHYILNETIASMNFSLFSEKICFIGHSHISVIYKENYFQVNEVEPKDVIESGKYIINVGSVGQPRDGNPKLSFGYFDTEAFKYQNIRVGYPVDISSKKILAEGLPAFLAERIIKGI
jgi:putative phosphoesterase